MTEYMTFEETLNCLKIGKDALNAFITEEFLTVYRSGNDNKPHFKRTEVEILAGIIPDESVSTQEEYEPEPEEMATLLKAIEINKTHPGYTQEEALTILEQHLQELKLQQEEYKKNGKVIA